MVSMFGKKFNTRTILIVVLILLIIVAACIVIINLPPKEEYLSVEDVLLNIRNNGINSPLINSTISVRGYYYFNEGVPKIVSTNPTTSGTTIGSALKIDYSNIENATDRLIQGSIYIFTGKLIQDTSNPVGFYVILVLENFARV